MDYNHFNRVVDIKYENTGEVLHFLVSHVEMLCKLFVNMKVSGERLAPVAKVSSIIYDFKSLIGL